MEYSLPWVFALGIRVGHADFMMFVSISFALGSQRGLGFWWNMGFREIYKTSFVPDVKKLDKVIPKEIAFSRTDSNAFKS